MKDERERVPGFGQVADRVIGLAFHKLDFDQELFVVQFLELFEKLRAQTNSLGESIILVVKTNQSDLE